MTTDYFYKAKRFHNCGDTYNPPNQNNIVTASAASKANRFEAMVGSLFNAARLRYVVVRRLKTLLNRRKLTSSR